MMPLDDEKLRQELIRSYQTRPEISIQMPGSKMSCAKYAESEAGRGHVFFG
jgi:hypothetical protein